MTITLPATPAGKNRSTMTAAVCRMARVAAAVTALAALAACTGNGTSPARSGAAAQEAQATPAQVAGTVHVCSSCHGFDGRSISPTFPRLAGQRAEYIEAQLKAFRDHTRADPHAHTYMWGMAAHLTDPLIKGIAAYYAAQTPASGTKAGSPVDIAAGKKIFEDGIPSHDVPACQACHGAHAEGMAAFPRLAGQHRQYLVEQLQNFASNARRNEIMHENSKNLTPEEISEVTDFLAAQ